jgi:hypothetical protein
MKKRTVVLSESQLKDIIKNVIIEAEEAIKLPKPIDVVNKVKKMFSNDSDNFSRKITQSRTGAATSTKPLGLKDQILSRYGKIKMTDGIFRMLQPANTEIGILVKNASRLNQYKVVPKTATKQYDYIAQFLNNAQTINTKLNAPKGQVMDLKIIHDEINYLNTLADNILTARLVSREGANLVQLMKKDIADALNAIESVVASMVK